jgi:hypothetical protein
MNHEGVWLVTLPGSTSASLKPQLLPGYVQPSKIVFLNTDAL